MMLRANKFMLVVLYAKLWIMDMVEHYCTKLMLFLPSSMFGVPILRIKQFKSNDGNMDSDENSDSEEQEELEFDVFINNLSLEYIRNGKMCKKQLHGLQLAPFVDNKGKFFIHNIQKYYPTLRRINLHYTKFKIDNNECIDNKKICYNVIRTIDADSKMDIVNNQSCKFGIVL